MRVYLDNDFKVHVTNDGTMRPYETDYFDGCCSAYIEGFRIKPDNETWVREDGFVFSGGEMRSPWKPYSELAGSQAQYERDMADLQKAYREGVNSV